jgi:hypothetical protein
MSDEPGASPALDLSDYERQVRDLEDCTRPLSVAQRESVAALQKRICAGPWATHAQRQRAHNLVLRLALLGWKGR